MFTPIRTYNTIQEAYIVQGLLVSQGIEAQVQGAESNSVFPSLDENGGAATVYVQQNQLQQAERVLQSHHD